MGVEGGPAEARELSEGETVEGPWTVTVPEDAQTGTVDLPVVATFGDRLGPLESDKTLPVHVLPEG